MLDKFMDVGFLLIIYLAGFMAIYHLSELIKEYIRSWYNG